MRRGSQLSVFATHRLFFMLCKNDTDVRPPSDFTIVIDAALISPAVTCTIDPGAFRILDAFIRSACGGTGRLEVSA